MRATLTALGRLPQWFILFIAQAAWFVLSLPFRLLSPALQFAILALVALVGYEALPELPRASLRQHVVLPAKDMLARVWDRIVWLAENGVPTAVEPQPPVPAPSADPTRPPTPAMPPSVVAPTPTEPTAASDNQQVDYASIQDRILAITNRLREQESQAKSPTPARAKQ